jgi:hypothetical protein
MNSITIGRNHDNTVVINDPNVSRHHCRIDDNGNGNYFIQDLNSCNGTFVNGQRIVGTVALRPTDIVKIGGTVLPWLNYFNNYDMNKTGIEPSPNYAPAPQYQQPQYQQPQYQQQPVGDKPGNFLAWSILCTIFCCLPFGIPAIVNSAQVDGRWNRGDYEGARRAAHKARVWFWWSFALGLFFGIIYLIYCIVVGVGVASYY